MNNPGVTTQVSSGLSSPRVLLLQQAFIVALHHVDLSRQ